MDMNNKSLVIALDYDETFTEDVVFWRNFVILAQSSNHSVTLVTYRTNTARDNNFDIEADAKFCGIDAVSYTHLDVYKRQVLH